MNREDYPSNAAYCRAIKEDRKSPTEIGTIKARYNGGERDVDKLVARPMTRQEIVKKSNGASQWNRNYRVKY